MEFSDHIPPSDKQIADAQAKLDFTFPPDYIEFIKSGYNLGNSILEPLEINAQGIHVDIFVCVAEAREFYNLPGNLLPICEDNSDYYCINEQNEVVFWSHNGPNNEKWTSVAEWVNKMKEEAS